MNVKDAVAGIIREMVEDYRHHEKGIIRDLPDGRRLKVSLSPDYDMRLEDSGDWFGKVEYVRRGWNGYSKRPDGFDGSARIVDNNRHGDVWWQPSPDAKGDRAVLDAHYKYVRGWYRDDWYFVSLNLELYGKECECCHGPRKLVDSSSVGVIESNSDTAHFVEVGLDIFSWLKD